MDESVRSDSSFLSVGAAELGVDFARKTISGTVDDFEDAEGVAISVEIELEMTSLFNGSNVYAGTTEGAIRGSDGERYNFDLPDFGVFLGDDAEQLSVEVGQQVGNVTTAIGILTTQ